MKKFARCLRRDLRRAFNALALAHHGEMLPRATKYRVIAGCAAHAPALPVAQPAGRRRRIALVLDGEACVEVLRYALDTATRFDADIDIITNLDEVAVRQAIAAAPGEAGHAWRLVRTGRDLLAGIAGYTRRNPDVLFVMSSAADPLTERYIQTAPAREAIRVPWLMMPGDLCAA